MSANQNGSQTVHLVSLGCPKNRVDSEVMAGLLTREGLELCAEPDRANVIVVNTCAFLTSATEESIETILEMARNKRDGACEKLIVTGCLPQRYREELPDELPEVDAFLGTRDFFRIVEAARGSLPRRAYIDAGSYLYDETTPRVQHHLAATSYVKLAEGCSRSCSFCIIPAIRGPQRSRPVDSIVSEVRTLVEEGTREIILIAQDTTRYGFDLPGKPPTPQGAISGDRSPQEDWRRHLPELITRLGEIDELPWVRLMYAYPQHFTDALIDSFGTGNMLPYLDLPLQHNSDRILRRMGRGLRQDDQQRLLDRLRRRVPNLVLRSTLIVGFPGETEAEFRDLADWVADVRFDHLGVFAYSREEGTRAAELSDQVPAHVAEQRRDELMRLQRTISREKNERLVGQTLTILVDGASEEHDWVYVGRAGRQAPEVDGQVILTFDDGSHEAPRGIEIGSFAQVEIVEASDYDLMGRFYG